MAAAVKALAISSWRDMVVDCFLKNSRMLVFGFLLEKSDFEMAKMLECGEFMEVSSVLCSRFLMC